MTLASSIFLPYISSLVIFLTISIKTANNSGRAVSICSNTISIIPLASNSLKLELSNEQEAKNIARHVKITDVNITNVKEEVDFNKYGHSSKE